MIPENENANYRICDNCGEKMCDGYILGTEHACCDGCAIALYHGDEVQFRADLEEFDDICMFVDCF